jgi:biotin--protein ligase
LLALPRHQGAAIDVRIKWPNDVYAGSLKLGGILCHSSYRDGQFRVIVGVGINLSNRQPTTCVDALIEQAVAAGRGSEGTKQQAQQQQQQSQQQQNQQRPLPVSRESLLAGILNRLEPMLARLASEGFEPFEADYCRHWLHTDQQVGLPLWREVLQSACSFFSSACRHGGPALLPAHCPYFCEHLMLASLPL